MLQLMRLHPNAKEASFLPPHRLPVPRCCSVAQSCSTLCDPMNCSTPGLPVHHQLPEFTQTHDHQVSDAIQLRNRFKGLDLIDRVPDEVWNEVHDIVQETGIKTIPIEKKCKKAKRLSGEALQIAVKRREVKSKGEMERYKHMNAEFQRIARRDKKAFLSDQCKEIEENNRMGCLY